MILVIFFGIIGVLIFGFLALSSGFAQKTDCPILLLFILGILFCFISAVLFYEVAYKDGQVDAALGKQKYHLVTRPDKTVRWEEKK